MPQSDVSATNSMDSTAVRTPLPVFAAEAYLETRPHGDKNKFMENNVLKTKNDVQSPHLRHNGQPMVLTEFRPQQRQR